MAKLFRAALIFGLALATARSARATVYVVQVGTGTGTLTDTSTATSILKFDDAGAPLPGTIALPTAASGSNKPFTLSGSATSEGFLALSANGQYLTMAGYAVAPGVTNLPDTSASTAARAVARITVVDGSVDTSTAFTGDSTYGNDNPRSAVSNDGAQFWMAGQNEGIRYATLGGTTSTQLNTSAPTNNRVVDIFNGQLYASSNAGTTLGVLKMSGGLPTTNMQTLSLLPGFPTGGTHSANDYWFKDASTLYVADDGGFASGGGIQKWTESGGTWTLSYTLLNNGATTTAVRGLTGRVDGSNVVLYATTSATNANRLISVTDGGAGSTATTLATAPANTAFRGVQFVGASTPQLDADYNDDGDVDGDDLNVWIGAFGTSSAGTTDDDSDTDGVDFLKWQRTFSPPLAGGVAAPEPGSLALAGLGLCVLRGARRQRRG